MKRYILLLITLFLVQHFTFSQITKTYSASGYSSFYLNNQPEFNSSIHSQYLNEDWENGSLQTRDGEIIKNVYFRYNLTYENFEMRFILNPSKVKRIYSEGKVYIYTKYIKDSKVDSAYFELLNEGKSSLMVKYSFKKIPGRKGAFGHDSYKQVITKYYIKYGDNYATGIKLRKKSILNSLPDKQDLISKYIKQEKLNLRFRKDIIQMLNYYDSL